MNSKHVGFLAVLVTVSLFISGCGAASGKAGTGSNDGKPVAEHLSSSSLGTPEAGSSSSTGITGSETPGPDHASSSASASSASSAAANAREFVGLVEAINGNQWTVGGQVFTIATGTEIKGTIAAGALVRVHVIANPDGTFTITEIQVAPAGATPGWDDHGGASSSASDNSSSSSSSTSSLETSSSSSSRQSDPTSQPSGSSGSSGHSGGGHGDGGGGSGGGGG